MDTRKMETVTPREAVASEVKRPAPEPLCGDFGGVNTDGEPCGRRAGWGRPDVNTGPCSDHYHADLPSAGTTTDQEVTDA